MSRSATILLLVALAGCGAADDASPIDVSVIGPAPALVDPNRRPLSAPSAALLQATAQGLVRFDGSGQVEPGLAIRWDVSDDGLYYTFRLDGAAPIDAETAARRLRAAAAPNGRNPLRHVLGAIGEIVAVTSEILEIRLVAPRPDMLSLLAQPELTLTGPKGGAGPLRIADRSDGMILLTPPPDPDAEEDAAPDRSRDVRLRGESAARAVARFAHREAGLVLGGSFADLAIARAANPGDRALRFDPVGGLFGLAVVRLNPFLADPAVRRALSMAVDRDRLAAAFGVRGWTGSAQLLPGAADLRTPLAPDWAAFALADRRAAARAAIAGWAGDERQGAARVRIALPDGPGARMLFAFIRQDWAAIGVEAEAVPASERAELRLIDEVAPGESAAWYLRRFTCDRAPVCSAEADAELAAARTALSLDQRALHMAAAQRLLEAITPFIPLARPLRWMLVGPGLDQVRENGRAAHPLYHLRAPPGGRG